MSNNVELELGKIFKASQERFVYFLLAASASSIGFAITQLEVEPLSIKQIPLAASFILWSCSFYCGLKFLENAIGVTFQNQNYLAFKRELKAMERSDANSIHLKFKTKYQATTDTQIKKMKFFGSCQSRTLLIGAITYFGWHLVRMNGAGA